MNLQELELEIDKFFTSRPVGMTIRTQEDLETIKKIAAALKEHKKPLHIRHMKWILELTGKILEDILLNDISL